jgi:signal transduction histidine kinase
MPRKSSLFFIAALLTAADVLCLLYLPASYDLAFIDGYEVLLCLIGAIACGLAAKRCAGFERYAWALVAAYFAALGLGDLSIFASGVSGGQRVPWLFHALGWSYSLPLGLLIFLPWRRRGEKWGLELTLDFAQVSLLSGLAFYWLIYMRAGSDAQALLPPLVVTVRGLIISAGLAARALADPSARARALLWRIAFCSSTIAVFQLWLFLEWPHLDAQPGHPRFYEVVRPLALLALAIIAFRWSPQDARGEDRNSPGYRFAWRLAMTLIPAMAPIMVLALWIYIPPRHRGIAAGGLAASFVLFVSRLAVTQYRQRQSTLALRAAEGRMRNLSYRLMRAQEDERARIAGELHDDIGQQMIGILIQLEAVQQARGNLDKALGEQLARVSGAVRTICDEVRLLSHHLHPATIDILGLVPALASFCQEFSEHTGIQVEFVHNQPPETFSGEAPICLYRVAQESLRNVQKHSGSLRARIELTVGQDAVSLNVTDSGNGFAPGLLDHSPGLGMASMAERVRGLGGDFHVESLPGQGTRIVASLPFPKAAGESPAQKRLGANAPALHYVDDHNVDDHNALKREA